MNCIVAGWMTDSARKAHLNMVYALKAHTKTVLKLDHAAVPREVRDRKNEYDRARKIRQNTWIEPKPKPAPRVRGFGE